MKLSVNRIKQFAVSLLLGAAVFVGASAPAFAQHHDRGDRHNRSSRRGGILGSIFGNNSYRYGNTDRHRRDTHNRRDSHYGNRGGYYGNSDRHDRNRGRGHDRGNGRGHKIRW